MGGDGGGALKGAAAGKIMRSQWPVRQGCPSKNRDIVHNHGLAS